jgi:hypothetical protein
MSCLIDTDLNPFYVNKQKTREPKIQKTVYRCSWDLVSETKKAYFNNFIFFSNELREGVFGPSA